MTPTPAQTTMTVPPCGVEDDVCVTGIAGYFPNSNSVQHLAENLFNKVDLLSDDERRWRKDHPEIPQRTGKIFDVQKFDASFFGKNFQQAHSLDPMGRLVLERVYECIIDAGVNPEELRNTNTGVFLGTCLSESEKMVLYGRIKNSSSNGGIGCFPSLNANLISQWLDLKGPSYSVDTACSSSLYALDHGYKAVRDGHCDAAIVTGVNLCLHPSMSLLFQRMGILSADGRCKSFDNRANGYARSESIVALLLQKTKDSRRVHAKIIHTKTNCDGYKAEGITYPAGHIQKMLLEKFYMECGVPPSIVEFMEAHGTGTTVGDPEELRAIDEIFCKDRNEPLLLGSIKSNLGHSEASSGMNSLSKACIAYNTGYLPPNINFESPREECPGLMEGRLQVVTEKQPWNRGLFAINSFGFGGANAHILLDNFSKKKINNGLPNDVIPRLVCVSGRTESAVAKILTDLASRPVDRDEVRLWHAIHERDIPGHDYRGYVLLDSTSLQGKSLARAIECIADVPPRSVWFKYTDLHLHWPAIAKQCMILPAFADAINRCSLVLKSKDIDLIKLFNDDVSRQRELTIVGAAAVYIGLTEVLKAGGIKPDYVVSYDIGELCSAYVDEYLTVEQTVNAAYEINIAIKNMLTTLSAIKVKHNFKLDVDLRSEDSYMEHHDDSAVIIAPKTNILNITNYLATRNVPWEYIGFNNSLFYRYLQKKVTKSVLPIIANRSKRWVPRYTKSKEHTEITSLNAIVIEIGFHGDFEIAHNVELFKKGATMISLLNETNHVESILKVLGKLYLEGVNPSLANIYPAVPFPVAQGTPMMSHLVEWDHCDDWTLANYSEFFITNIPFGQRTVQFYMADDRHSYLYGHEIDGRIIFPGTCYLYLVWEAYSDMTNRLVTKTSVVFEDIYFQRATNIPKTGTLEFKITIHFETGSFEVTEDKTSVATGHIRELRDSDKSNKNILTLKKKHNRDEIMTSKDIYKELKIRGYQFKGQFRRVHNYSVDGSHGEIVWNDNWVTFLDAMLQVKFIGSDTRALYLPNRIEKITIDTAKHSQALSELKQSGNDRLIDFEYFPDIYLTRAGGVEVREVHVSSIFKKAPRGIPVLEKNLFIANFCHGKMTLCDVLRCNLQIIHENIQIYKFKSIELIDEEYNTNNLLSISEDVAEILADFPLVQTEMLVISSECIKMPSNITVENKKLSGESNTTLFIGANLLKRQYVMQEAFATLKKDCFILSREKAYNYEQNDALYDIITVYFTETEHFVLLRSKREPKPTKFIKITSKDMSFSWIEDVKNEIQKEEQKLILYSENEPVNGLLGLVNCLRKEPGGEIVHGLLIADPTAPSFSAECNFYKAHLDKDLCTNVFKNGQWGTYRHVLLEELKTLPTAHAYANVATIGDLNSLRYWEGPLSEGQIPKPGHILVNVYCAALNFRDIMTAMGRVSVDAVARGRLAQDCVQGMEVAGRTANGSRVFGICLKGITNLVEDDPNVFMAVPDEWSLEEAVTVPVAYMTAYLALVVIGKIRRGESILIHAGSGGVGQAAISVALHYGLEVFTTVGTPAKREFIKRLFPQIKDSHIGSSRDTLFEHMIRREMNCNGVDLVLNSLSDEKLQASVKCLNRGGRFLEIGKYDITINTQLEMCFLQKEVSFHGIMLDYINEKKSFNLRMALQQLILKGIQSGAVRPLTHCIFEKNELHAAYRYMAAGKHIGKVIIKIRDEEPLGSCINPMPALIDAVPRYTCREDRVYVLVGGMGGFGLELADWLVVRGAKKIVMCSRRGISNGYQRLRIRIWKSYGVDVQIFTHDVATEEGCEEMLRMAATVGSVQAIFNLAVVLNDAVFQNQTPETFRNSFMPKAMITMLLDKFSRIHCPELKEFVVFSSVSCGRGNAGQTNYGFSNSVMERICEERKSAGLPAVAIQWGAIGDVGLVADMQEENVELEIGGTLQQGISSCLKVMDKFLKQDATIVSSIVVAEKRAANAGVDSVVDVIGSILGINDMKTVSQQAPLSEMGMDSVMAVEIKQTLERDYEIFLTAQEIRMLTIAKLIELTAKDSATEQLLSAPSTNKSSDAIAAAGLEMFVRNFGDEKMASEPFVCFNYDEKKTADSKSNNVLFMLPGIESCASAFEPLCSKIDANVCVLQLGLQHDDNFEQAVDRLHKTIKPLLRPNAPFSLLGYSFGSVPILKLAAKLENEGHKGIVFCLDGSPEYVKCLTKEFLNSSDEINFQNSVICHVFNKVCPTNNANQILMKELKNIKTFEDKIKCAIKIVPTTLIYSDEFMYSMAKVIFSRINLISDLDLNIVDKINSPIVLIRVKKVPLTHQCNENYGLDKLTNGNVTVHCIEESHSSIVESEECASIVNSALSVFINKI